jgi:hypothetical protein
MKQQRVASAISASSHRGEPSDAEAARPTASLEELDTVTFVPANDLLVLAGARAALANSRRYSLDIEIEEQVPSNDIAHVLHNAARTATPPSPRHAKSELRMRSPLSAVTTTASVWPLHVASEGGPARAAAMAMDCESLDADLAFAERQLGLLLQNSTRAILLADMTDWLSLLAALRVELELAFGALRDPRLAAIAGPRTNLGTYLYGLMLAARATSRAVAICSASFDAAVDDSDVRDVARATSPLCFIELVPFVLAELDALSPAMANDGAKLSGLRSAVERSSWHASALRASALRA